MPPMTGPTPPLSSAPAPAAVPVTGAPAYALEDIARAGAALVDAGKMDALQGLLDRYGVRAVTQLRPEQYGAFATELRQLGGRL